MSKQQIQKLTEEYTHNPVTKKYERVAAYIRVSTQEQKLHGISLDAQRDKLKEYAEKHHLKIVGWYEDEGVSGRKLIKNRPALQRMLNDAQAGKFDRIIFIKLDRFFRSVAEYHECMKKLDPVLWTATEEKYDLTTANGRAFVNMKLTIAELEADQTGERIDIVNDYKIKTGQAITGAHMQGIAFTVKKDKEGVKRVVQDPETKELVMDFINHYLTYQSKKQSVIFINNKYNTNLSYNALSRMLIDTKLYGHYHGNDNYCEPYINKATFDKIQYILKTNSIKSTPSRNLYLFSGLLSCPKCGRKLSATSNSKGVLSYRCNRSSRDAFCTFSKHVNENKIQKALLDNMDNYVTKYVTDAKIEDTRKKDDNAEEKVRAINEELRKVNRMYKAGNMTDKEYDADTAEIKERLALAEAELAPIIERDLTRYEELLKSGWRDLYEALNKDNKRAFWRKYLKAVEINEDAKINRVIFF